MRERMTCRHQSSRNLAAHAGGFVYCARSTRNEGMAERDDHLPSIDPMARSGPLRHLAAAGSRVIVSVRQWAIAYALPFKLLRTCRKALLSSATKIFGCSQPG